MKLPAARRRSKKTKALKAVRSGRLQVLGAVAVLGGMGAAIARILKGRSEPDPFAIPYEPPAPEPPVESPPPEPEPAAEEPEPAAEPAPAAEEPARAAEEPEPAAEEPESPAEEPES